MRFGKHLLVTAATAFLGACAATGDGTQGTAGPFANADILDASGKSVGAAVIAPSGNNFALELKLSGIAPGEHGMHLHMVGACDLPDFTSAGSHLNPHGKQHGRDNPQGSHLGDLPNITADASGAASISVPLNSTHADLQKYLMDADGTAIVVHATADDYLTDPTGNSGGRIACGIFKQG